MFSCPLKEIYGKKFKKSDKQKKIHKFDKKIRKKFTQNRRVNMKFIDILLINNRIVYFQMFNLNKLFKGIQCSLKQSRKAKQKVDNIKNIFHFDAFTQT